MSLQLLLYWLHLRRDLLISEHEIWWSSLGPDRRIERALQRHRRGLAVLIAWSSIETCPAAGLHRRYWRYKGNGQFECSACARLYKEVS